ncbi:uncharacterized protein LOC129218770 [Uloborus diversus]|uniref:uncharacterized protein LOC129218770 n=1 Tax=Uloborus diversus TaxID=327109 RepID=UPI002409276D|nr:uncharacterized protein LOC129218770 [Uloborus diversus]
MCCKLDLASENCGTASEYCSLRPFYGYLLKVCNLSYPNKWMQGASCAAWNRNPVAFFAELSGFLKVIRKKKPPEKKISEEERSFHSKKIKERKVVKRTCNEAAQRADFICPGSRTKIGFLLTVEVFHREIELLKWKLKIGSDEMSHWNLVELKKFPFWLD